MPLLAVASSLVARRIKRARSPGSELFYPVLLAFNVAFLCAATCWIHWFGVGPAARIGAVWNLTTFAGLISLFTLAAIASVPALDRTLGRRGWVQGGVRAVYFCTPLLGLITLIHFGDFPHGQGLLLIGALAGVSLLHPWLVARTFSPRVTRAIDGLTVLLVALLVLDLDFHVDPAHSNFYLGPTTDLMLGKSLLVDINAQYGVGVIYFLAALFEARLAPFSYQGLSLVVSVLYAIQFAAVYWLLRWLTKSVRSRSSRRIGQMTISRPSLTPAYPSIVPCDLSLPYLLCAGGLRISPHGHHGFAFAMRRRLRIYRDRIDLEPGNLRLRGGDARRPRRAPRASPGTVIGPFFRRLGRRIASVGP